MCAPLAPLPFPVPMCGVGVRAGPGSRLCPALLRWVVGVCFLGFILFLLCGVGCWVSLSRALWSLSPHPLSFGLGCWLFFFSWCVSACFGVPFPAGPLFLAWCCRFWLGGPPMPLWGSCLRCLLGVGLAASGGVGGRFAGCGLFSRPPPSPLCCFFFGGGEGGLPVPPSAFPGLAHALARIQCCLPGCCWRLRSVWPCSGPMGRVGYVHVGLGAPSCRVRSWLCRLGGCARGLGLFVSFPLCGAGFNLLGGPPLLLPGAQWPLVWPAVPVCGVLVRRLPGCAVACFGWSFRLGSVVPCCAALCRVASRRAVVRCTVARCGAVCRGLVLCRGGSVEVSLACVVVRSVGRSVAGWWLGGAVRCGCLAGSFFFHGGLGVPLGLVGRVGVRGVALPGGLCLGPVSSWNFGP